MVQGAQEMCVKKLVGIAISQGIKSIVFLYTKRKSLNCK